MTARHTTIPKPRAGGVLTGLALVAACILNAQVPTLSGRAHVRLTTREPAATISGTVFSQSEDTIRIVSGGAVHSVPAASIVRIEVGSGRSRGAGAVRGAKIGALVVGGLCLALCGSAYLADTARMASARLAEAVAFFAYSGAFDGAIIGAIVGVERFTTVYPERVSLSIAPDIRGATQIGLALRF